MKPLYLEMSAFGSYGDLEVVDFSTMRQGIFLITGDTGAGKTTIFDAIMYALYDQTSGGRREGNMMRSQYAADDKETYVKLIFSYRGREYTICRNPEYLRPGKRRSADGSRRMVKEAAGVELILPDGSTFQGKKREVDKKIQEIIGLDSEQFRQVAMIAQGDFLKLLLAPSGERKQIFSRIFHTKLYARIQEVLRIRSRELQEQIQETVSGCLRELQGVKCQENSPYEEAWQNLKEEPEFSMEETLALLAKIVDEDVHKKASLQQERKLNKKKRESAEELLRLEKVLEEDQRRLEENEKQQKFLEGWLEEQSGVLEELLGMREAAREALMREEEGLSLQITRLRDSLKNYEILENRRKEYKEASKTHLQGKKTLEQSQKQQEQIRKKIQQLQETLKTLEDLPIQRIQAENLLAQFEARRKELMELKKELALLERTGEQMEKAKVQYVRTQENAREAACSYDAAYEQFFREQAGILAQELRAESPCPVCGSTKHPSPAPLSEGAPTQEQVNVLRRRREDAEQKREKAYLSYMEWKQRCEGMWEQLSQVGSRLLEENNYQPDKDGCVKVDKKVEDVDKYLDKSRADVDKIRQQEAGQEELRKDLEKNRKKLEQVEAEQEILEGKQQEESVRLSGLEKEIQLLQSNLAFEDAKEARRELKETESRRSQLQSGASRAENDYNKKEKEIQLAIGQKKAGEEYGKQLQKELQKSRKTYQKKWESYTEQYVYIEEEGDLNKNLEETLSYLQQQDKILEKSYLKAYNTAHNNRQALQNLCTYQESQWELQKSYTLYNDLSQTANGTLSGSIKVDFETYVQRQYFKKIIGAANRRLVLMNNQQFILQCRAIENLGNQGQVGLDLDVYHLVNDSVRDVKTLSGGESFMAALAMALGLADIIQNEAGAIRLQTMFVDEGFGSLDDEARAQAIQVLLKLADDSRLVGIISHVNELKEQMEHKLLVTKDNHGSHVKWAES